MAHDETEMKEKEAGTESEADGSWVLCRIWPAGW